MRSISVHDAKTHLSRLLKKVQEGEEIIITSSGKPVAKLTAPPQAPKRVFGDLAPLADQFLVPENINEPMPEEWFLGNENDPLNQYLGIKPKSE